jgi:hypothetical protein
MNEAISKRDEIENKPVDIEITTGTRGNVFKSLGEILPFIGENNLKLIIFGYCVLMIYLGVMLTYWSVELNDTPNVTPVTPSKPEIPTNEIPVTDNVTPTVTPVTDNVTDIKSHAKTKKPCPVCGKPVKVKATYCGGRCRQIGHRHPEIVEQNSGGDAI